MTQKTSLRASFYDGFFSTVMVGLTSSYMSPFAILVGASNFVIGLLSALPQLAGAVLQLRSAEVTDLVGSRVKFTVIGVAMQATALLLMAFIIMLPQSIRIETFLILAVISGSSVAFIVPAWASLMSDTIDKTKYGTYFAWRNRILGIVAVIVSLAAGVFLSAIKNKVLGFSILFVLGAVVRYISVYYVSLMDDVSVIKAKEKKFTYLQFILRAKESNFAKFVIFMGILYYTTFWCSPFFAPYMLKELKMDYTTYILILTAGSIAGIFSLPLWGKLTDKYGNAKIIKTSARLMPLIPLLWIVSGNTVYLMIANALAAYIWSGMGLAAMNFIFDTASPETRTRCVAYYNFTVGVCIFLGSITGGWIISVVPPLVFNSTYLTMFLISGIGRWLCDLFMLSNFEEVKPVEHIGDREILVSVIGITSPVSNIVSDVWSFFSPGENFVRVKHFWKVLTTGEFEEDNVAKTTEINSNK
ncbi:MAG: MFS transporter [Elusimicrobiota bacterium]